MKILIVGGSCFLGPSLCAVLGAQRIPHEISVFNRGNRPTPPGVHQHLGDRNHRHSFDVLRDHHFDVVIDTCCYTEEHAAISVAVFSNITSHYLIVSSAAVYLGQDTYPVTETMDCANFPDEPLALVAYARNKLSAEQVFLSSSMPCTIIRPCFIYGESKTDSREKTILRAIANKSPINLESPERLLQLLHINDLSEAMVKIACSEPPKKSIIYNISSDQALTHAHYLSLLRKVSSGMPVLNAGEPIPFTFPYPNWHCLIDDSNFRSDFNWQPEMSFTDGLAAIVSASGIAANAADKYSESNTFETLTHHASSISAPINDSSDPLFSSATLMSALQDAAVSHPLQKITTISKTGYHESITYSDLHRNALNIAPTIHALMDGQKLAILSSSNTLEFLSTFWALQYAGIAPILFGPCDKLTSFDQLNDVYVQFQQPKVFASSEYVEELYSHSCTGTRSLAADVIRLPIRPTSSGAATKIPLVIDPEQCALILLTSGSTGKPKGVMQSHRAIRSRTRAVVELFDLSGSDVNLNWMPMEHVGGIVMCHIQDIVARAAQVHVATEYVLASPSRWITLLSSFKATMTWAPSFAFKLVAEETLPPSIEGVSLTSLRLILNAGETINISAANAFLKLLAPYGLRHDAMYPCWGTSELCSGVTFKKGISEPVITRLGEFVSVGKPLPGYTAKIVNDNDEVMVLGSIGNLMLHGPSIFMEYFNDPANTKSTLTTDRWYRTGDLALMHNDELVITGRVKDIAIVNGVNISFHEIEQVATKAIGDARAIVIAAMTKVNEDQEKLIVFFTVDQSDIGHAQRMAHLIRRALLVKLSINPDEFVAITSDALPKTNIGKVQRSELSKRLAENKLSFIWRGHPIDDQSNVPDTSEDCQILLNIMRSVFHNPTLSLTTNIFSLGIDSIKIYQLASALNDQGFNVSAKHIYQYETCIGLAQFFKKPSRAE